MAAISPFSLLQFALFSYRFWILAPARKKSSRMCRGILGDGFFQSWMLASWYIFPVSIKRRPRTRDKMQTADFRPLLDDVFVISRNKQGGGTKPKADNTNRDLDYFEYHRNWIVLYIVLKKITTNALSHQTQFIFDKPCSYVNFTLLLEIMRANYGLFTNLLAGKWIISRLRCFPELTLANEKTDGDYNV